MLPFTAGFPPGLGVEGIRSGPLTDELIRQISVHRVIDERFSIDIDHDASRLAEGELLGGGNVYSLRYTGSEGDALREIGLGNLQRSIAGTRYVPLDAGMSDSFALRAVVSAGPVDLEALARYGASLEGRRRFRGTRQLVEMDLLDVDYVRARFFLLPDAGIDSASLRLVKSLSTGELTIDGRRFTLLQAGIDYRLDNAAGQLWLKRSLGPSEELCVTYTKAGQPVGSSGLGANAIIDAAGARQAFTRSAFPAYFAPPADGDWLFLRTQGLNSYWEMRNAFALDDLDEGRIPDQLSAQILRTATLAPNAAYAGLEDRLTAAPAAGVVFFTFADSVGLHPRPFPGEAPFAPPITAANNPYDPANPIYGGLAPPPSSASLTTVRVRYLLSTDLYSLGPGVIKDSVRVTVDGALLAPNAYAVDTDAGTISFPSGTIGPESDVEVFYKYAPFAGAGRELLAAVGARAGDERLGARNLLTLELPIADPPAPRLGEERGARITDSLDAAAALGARPDDSGFSLELKGSAALGLAIPNPAGLAVVADMEDDRRSTVGLSDNAWMIASRSQVLPALSIPVALGDRGDLRFENYWQEQPFGGEVLRDLSWDNAENPHFAYAEKAGPYNAAEEAAGGNDQSLVLDVSFPAGATDAYASISTTLPGADLSGYGRLRLTLRGQGVSGDSLLVYLEALDRFGEDINDNGLLDGETSASDPGFAITPLGGGTTRIGSNRRGESNARLDSEDRNGNGSLDGSDEGVLIAPEAGPSYVAALAEGTGGWTELTVDIANLVRNNPRTFQDARAIRMTVKPASPVTAAAVTGRVIVNGLWFAASSLTASSGLAAEELSAGEAAIVRDHPFSGAYPGLYERLHGNSAWREEKGLTEKSLACTVTAPITAGATEAVNRPFVPLADFRSYRFLRLYLYRPSGPWPAADAGFTLALSAGGLERFTAVLAPSGFSPGWNEVSFLLEAPWTVTVGGAEAGALVPSGGASAGMLSRVASASFGITAGASGVPEGVVFWLDEWHLAESRVRLDAALLADARAGLRGALLRAGGFPLLSDPFLSAVYEHRQGAFLGPADRSEDRLQAGLDAVLARWLSTSFVLSRMVGQPTVPDSAVPVGLREDTTDRQALRVSFDAGIPWVPVLEHRWERTAARLHAPAVTPTESLVIATGSDRESMTLAERMGGADGLRQSWSFTRTWSADGRNSHAASDGTLLGSSTSYELADAHDGSLAYTWDGGEVLASLGRLASYAVPAAGEPAGPPASWFARLGQLFCDPAAALPGSHLQSMQDRLALSASVPLTATLGLSASWEAGYSELNSIPGTGERDVACTDSISLGLPVSPNRGGRLVLTPEVSLGFTGSYRKVSPSLSELSLVFSPYPSLLLAPLSWLDPNSWGRSQGHAAADAFSADPSVTAAAASVIASSSLAAQLASGPWYLPSRAVASLRDETGREGAARTQKRTVSFSFGKDARLDAGASAAPASTAGTLSSDTEASFTRDYALKLRSLSLSERWAMRLAGLGGGDLQVDHSISWTRERQSIGDPALSLYPNTPDGPGTVAIRPDRDSLRNALTVGYDWHHSGSPSRPAPTGIVSGRGTATVQAIRNTEKLVLENILAWTTSALPVSSVPIRGSFEHISQIQVSDTFTLGLSGKTAAGVERRSAGGSELVLPAVGFELGVTARFSF